MCGFVVSECGVVGGCDVVGGCMAVANVWWASKED